MTSGNRMYDTEQLAEPVQQVHHPRNVNHAHKAEQQSAGWNTRIAVLLTRIVSNMWCAYAFAALALVGLLGILGYLSPVVILLVAWVSQTFLQLCFLPILSVGQSVLSRHQELQADETYQFTVKSYHDIEQVMNRLSTQDTALTEALSRLNTVEDALVAVEAKLPVRRAHRKTEEVQPSV